MYMRNLILFFTYFTLTACASSVADVNSNTQAVATGGQSVLGEKMNAGPDDKFKDVNLSISGNVVLSDKCQFMGGDFLAEITKYESFRPEVLATAKVTPELVFNFSEKIHSGKYRLRLIKAQGSKKIDEKIFTADKDHNSFSFTLQGCP